MEFGTYIFALLPPAIFLKRTLPSILFRRTSEFERKQKEHQAPTGNAGRLLERILQSELSMLRKKWRIPFGGSCLAVARAT
jgi:hypothetical protein